MACRVSKVAGDVFPADAAELAQAVSGLAERDGALRVSFDGPPCAIVAPYGGLARSGKLTAAAWASRAQACPDRIAVLSPSHVLESEGIAAPTGHGAVEVLGKKVKLDREAARAVMRARQARGYDAVFEAEHGIDL